MKGNGFVVGLEKVVNLKENSSYLVVVWSEGKIEIRSEKTGEIFFEKDLEDKLVSMFKVDLRS